MSTFIIPEGPYAIFNYKGSSTDNRIYSYIFEKWIPSLYYDLDNRPHLEILGKKYRNNHSNSEEELYYYKDYYTIENITKGK